MLEALEWFEPRLGRDWSGWNDGHAFAINFPRKFGEREPEGVRLYNLARVLDDGPGLEDVIRRLGALEWRDYYTALTELEVAAPMRTAGRAVELIAPVSGAPNPDFRVKLCERFIACECTALIDSEAEQNADAVMDFLLTFPPTLLIGSVRVRFERDAAAQDAFARLSELERAIVDASKTGRRAVLPKIAVVEPLARANEHPTVLIEEGGLAVGNVDKPLTQLGRSIRKKLTGGQLSESAPGVVLVRTRAFSLYASNLAAWLDAAVEVALESFDESASVASAVVVHERWRGESSDQFFVVGQHSVVFAGNDAQGSSRFVAFVRNPRAVHPLSGEEVEQLDRR